MSELLISIKPKHIDKIFSSLKTVELRRTRPNPKYTKPGTIIWLYASSPRCQLQGKCILNHVIENSPPLLIWSQVHQHCAITYQEFVSYYQGATTGYGLYLTSVIEFPKPINLSTLRQQIPQFHPPQTYRYLNSVAVEIIEKLLQ
jgi:predicted transcriptional regulator